jgi:hypothetical protein
MVLASTDEPSQSLDSSLVRRVGGGLAAMGPGENSEVAKAKPLQVRLKNKMIEVISEKSDKLWMSGAWLRLHPRRLVSTRCRVAALLRPVRSGRTSAVFNECDLDKDGDLTSREACVTAGTRSILACAC